MCGIAGQVAAPGERVNPDLIRAMTAALRHRGPDGEGWYEDAGCGLGHRRLSLIDLATGGQPIANEDNSIQVVSNSEIYNYVELRAELQARGHTFRTAGDTEVIVHLYEELGPQVVERLVGMFAFALWDARRETLILARDRFGIKPLYYAIDGRHRLVFASELKSLLQDDAIAADLDYASLQQYFFHLTIPEPATAFTAVRKVPAGHLLSWHGGALTTTSYWDLTAGSTAAPGPDDASAIAALDASLASSVALTLRSDVPVGVFLSGGIDSSLLTWYATQQGGTPIQTFSVSFAEAEFDESPYSRLVAEHCRTDHHEVRVTMDEAADVLLHLASSLDEPFADSSCIPTYVLSREARRSVKAVLTGEGSDELFAGSGWHANSPGGQSLEELLLPGAKAVFTREALHELLSADFRAAADAPRPHAPGLREKLARCAGPLERRLCVDLHEYLPSDLLMKTDRMTMLASLEARVPFLNHPFVETAWSLPSSLKLRDGIRKYALKQLARGRLPDEIIARPKKGFSIPMDVWLWMKGRFRDLVFDTLLASRTKTRGLFNTARVESMLREHDRLQALHGYRLWTLFVFELWHRQFVDSRRTPVASGSGGVRL